jgi:hypothetical protein
LRAESSQNPITQFLVRQQGCRSCRYPFTEVALVENDQNLDVLTFGGDDAAGDQIVRKRRFGGDDDDDLCHIGGDQFLLAVVRAIEQRSPRFKRGDDALVGARSLHLDLVTADQFALFATRNAEQRLAIAQLDPVLPPVSGDDAAGQSQIRASASILAAQMKSLRDRPATSCVL